VNLKSEVRNLLERPAEQRRREYKYRCAQSLVFGIPVILLQYFGHRLGGPEAARWVFVLQALLAGWVMYVGAAGMLLEGLILLRRRILPDLLVALVALGLYLAGLLGPLPLFHLSVMVVAAWTGIRWAAPATCRGEGSRPTVSSDNFSRGE
jgi:cation transport ATPase